MNIQTNGFLNPQNNNMKETDTKSIDEVLCEIFSQVPLPPPLKSRKQRWIRGELKILSKLNIIEKHSDYVFDEASTRLKKKEL